MSLNIGFVWFNIWFGLIFIITNFIMVSLVYRFFGRVGMFFWIAIIMILANIQVLKLFDLFTINSFVLFNKEIIKDYTLVATLGNSLYGSIFLATDILSENYGKKEANKSVWIGFISALVMIVTMQLALLFIPSQEDFASEALKTIFSFTPRIIAASLMAYLTSQFLDVYLFHRFKEINNNRLWLRNNVSTMISQLIDTFIFSFIAFFGIVNSFTFIGIIISTYVLKFIVALIDTPFVYLARKIKEEGKVKEV